MPRSPKSLSPLISSYSPRPARTLAGAFAIILLLAPHFASAVAFRTTFVASELMHADGTGGAGAVGIGDVNGDGRADAVIVRGPSWFEVFLGQGDGRFAGPSTIGTTGLSYPEQVRVQDVTGDGNVDLIFVGGHTSVVDGLGGGLFAAPRLVATESASFAVAADLNADGIADLVTGTSPRVRLNLGSGVFDSTISVGLWNARDAAVADLGTGAGVELVFATTDERLLLMAAADLGWMPPVTDLGPAGATVAIGDLNEDGRADLVTGDFVYLQEAGGGFTPGTAAPAEARALADVDGDGHLDLVALNPAAAGSRSLLVARGRGDGAFDAAQSFLTATSPTGVAVADLDGVGPLDVVVVRASSDGAAPRSVAGAYLGEAALYPAIVEHSVGSEPTAVAVAEVTGDDLPDVLTADAVDGAVSLLPGYGAAGFGPRVTWSMGVGCTDLAVADFDGDGLPDLATTLLGGVALRRGLPSGGFGPRTEHATGTPTSPPTHPFRLSTGDFDEDGRMDLVVADSLAAPSVLFGQPGGGFGAPLVLATSPAGGGVTVVDHDDDGNLDVMVVRNTATLLFRGNGAGGFTAAPGIGRPSFQVRAALAADLDHDGIDDYVVATDSSGMVRAQVGDLSWAIGPTHSRPVLADVDGDGHLDLLSPCRERNAVAVLRGRGDGTFEPRVDWAAGHGAASVAVADLDLDGRMELVVAHRDANTVSVLRQPDDHPTPTLASLVESAVEGGRVRLTWYAAAGASSGTVERRRAETTWSAVGEGAFDGAGYLRFEDANAEAGARYAYRLVIGGVASAEAWVDVPSLAAMRIESVAPTGAAVRVRFALASAAVVELALFDVAGRAQAARHVGGLAGSQEVVLGERLGAGVYFVRLRAGSQAAMARVALLP